MDSNEFVEWLAYWELEPWGEERADLRNAMLAQCVTAPYSKHKTKLSDFVPKFDKPKQDWRQVQAYFIALSKGPHGRQHNRES